MTFSVSFPTTEFRTPQSQPKSYLHLKSKEVFRSMIRNQPALADNRSVPTAESVDRRADLPASKDGELAYHKRQYRKRKQAGLCTATGCPKKAAPRHTHCQKHLALMSRKHKQRYQKRSAKNLCIYCGERPGFWGVRCIICRQKFANDPLPSGARRAIQRYREAESLLEFERLQAEARFVARKLLATGDIQGPQAKALCLYTGIDDGRWRTYEEVGRRMHISKQRVHKLLEASNMALEAILGALAWQKVSDSAPKALQITLRQSRTSLRQIRVRGRVDRADAQRKIPDLIEDIPLDPRPLERGL